MKRARAQPAAADQSLARIYGIVAGLGLYFLVAVPAGWACRSRARSSLPRSRARRRRADPAASRLRAERTIVARLFTALGFPISCSIPCVCSAGRVAWRCHLRPFWTAVGPLFAEGHPLTVWLVVLGSTCLDSRSSACDDDTAARARVRLLPGLLARAPSERQICRTAIRPGRQICHDACYCLRSIMPSAIEWRTACRPTKKRR